MLSKQDLIKRLREHPLYRAALASVDTEQAKKIAAVTEGFLGKAIDGMIPMIKQASDAETLAEAQSALKETGELVNIEPVSSGSKDD